MFYYHALLVAFLLLGLVQYALAQSSYGPGWRSYVFVALDFALLSYTVIAPNPLQEVVFPPQMPLRFGVFIYYFVLLTAVAFSYTPRLMLWAGLSGALGWCAGVYWLVTLPETRIGEPEGNTTEAILAVALDPRFVDLGVRLQEVVVLLIVTGILAAVVARSRQLVARQAAAARERANLSRYFPPNIVEDLARTDEPLGAVREQPVAVMFVDIVGFTRLAEDQPADQIIALLREFHARLERAVFDNGGTLDKFLGDGVMATFGTPSIGPRDAANAVACAQAILAAIESWNVERAGSDSSPVRVSIGIHYGPVVLGDVGSARRLEFAVVGDAVNVASRLEELTRSLGCQIAVSDDLARAARAQADNADALLGGFREMGPQPVRGREQRVAVWAAGD